jgi:hypothetical protein
MCGIILEKQKKKKRWKRKGKKREMQRVQISKSLSES